ncbi:MAG: hypothetical protein HY885_06760 [Deltaproteobacteria bacterium]|nr:hypothetical protein [Deltaproteobacteria bacterium]
MLTKKTVLTWGVDFGKITLPQLLEINHWIVIVLCIAGGNRAFPLV